LEGCIGPPVGLPQKYCTEHVVMPQEGWELRLLGIEAQLASVREEA